MRDRDTSGVPGSPDIAATIFDKIKAADIFVGDVSFINQGAALLARHAAVHSPAVHEEAVAPQPGQMRSERCAKPRANWSKTMTQAIPMALVELGRCHVRVARPSDNLDAVVKFYRDGLGFTVLYEFTDHDGFDGVMLGNKGADYHLEFTRKHGHKAGKAPTEDNLLVFYLPDASDWQQAVDRMQRHGHRPVK